MAMKGLIEGECGGANPLMKFANHFVPDRRNLPAQLTNGRNQLVPIYRSKQLQNSTGQELADEFVSSSNALYKTAPSTFNMYDLLQEIQQQQNLQPPQQRLPQHLQQPQQQPPQHMHSTHMQPHQASLQPQHNTTTSFDLEFELHQQQTTGILNEAGGWLREYRPQPIESLASEWGMDFMEDRQEGFEHAFNHALTFNQSSPVIQLDSDETQENSSTPVHDVNLENDLETGEEWAQEFSGQKHQDVWSNMVDRWNSFTEGWNEDEEWAEDFRNFSLNDVYKDYKFEDANPLVMDGREALDEGIKRMNEGDVANAVLFLETAVKQDPSNAMAWFYLGTSQADNEQEPLAIAAFNRCLQLDPSNLKALQSLAVGYTNEGLPHKAYEHLLRWISSNHKYQSLVSSRPASEADKISHSDLLQLYLQAVQLDKELIDPELQTCLGIIFNLSAEYSKAVDCFRTALQISPQDSMLWNKLGATLANGQMSEQSIVAYRNALSLRPGYVRTRFNLGVACINLGAYRESIEHFLSALKLQSESKGPLSQRGNMDDSQPSSSSPPSSSSQPLPSSSSSAMSSHIWQSLRLSLSLLGRNELLESCDSFDLRRLVDEFNV